MLPMMAVILMIIAGRLPRHAYATIVHEIMDFIAARDKFKDKNPSPAQYKRYIKKTDAEPRNTLTGL